MLRNFPQPLPPAIPIDPLHIEEGQPLQVLSVSRGSTLARSSIQVQLLEENSEALLQGLHVLDLEMQKHTHVVVEHVAPYTRSRQHFKGILGKKPIQFRRENLR